MGCLHGLRVGVIRAQRLGLRGLIRPDGRRLACCGQDGTVRLRDPDTQAELGPPMRHTDSVSTIAFDPTGRVLASGGRDSRIRLFQIT